MKRTSPLEQRAYCGNRPSCPRTTSLKIADYQCGHPSDDAYEDGRIHRRASHELAGIVIQCPSCAHYTVFYHPSEDSPPSPGQKSPK